MAGPVNPIVDPITPSAVAGVQQGSTNLNEAANRANQAAIASQRNATELQMSREQLIAQAQEHAKYQEFLGGESSKQQAATASLQQGHQGFESTEAQKQRDFTEKLSARALQLQMLQKKHNDDISSAHDDMLHDALKVYGPIEDEQKKEEAKLSIITNIEGLLGPLHKKAADDWMEAMKTHIAGVTTQEKYAGDAMTEAMAARISNLGTKPSASDSPFEKFYKTLNTSDADIGMVGQFNRLPVVGNERMAGMRTPLDQALAREGSLKVTTGASIFGASQGLEAVTKSISAALGVSPESITPQNVLHYAARAGVSTLIDSVAPDFVDRLASSPGYPGQPNTDLSEVRGLATSFLHALHKATNVGLDQSGGAEASKSAQATVWANEVKPTYDKLAEKLGPVQALEMVRSISAIGKGEVNIQNATEAQKAVARGLGADISDKGLPEGETKLRKAMGNQFVRMEAMMRAGGIDTAQKTSSDVAVLGRMAADAMGKADSFDQYLATVAHNLNLTPEETERKFGGAVSTMRTIYQTAKEAGGPNKVHEATTAQTERVRKLGELVTKTKAEETGKESAKLSALRKQHQDEEQKLADLLAPKR